VTGIHSDLDQNQTMITGQTLIATTERSAVNRPRNAAVDMGGAMELRGLVGNGAIMIRTPQRDVSCDQFDYNLVTHIAELNAQQGRSVSVATRGNPNVMNAAQMRWDMAQDVITITHGSGTANR
jgi:hypothetical protein